VSKAFTKEDEPAETVARPPPVLAPGEKRYVTADGFRALQQELDRLAAARAALRGEAGFDEVARAKELERQGETLAATLATLTVVTPDPARADRVFFGAWVTLVDEDGGEVTYRLVGPDEADAKAGLVSVESPLAKALLGKEVGDEVTVDRPRGRLEYTVTGLAYEKPLRF
jgi:transcription elongation factor GreB